jgi:hypothetical protein
MYAAVFLAALILPYVLVQKYSGQLQLLLINPVERARVFGSITTTLQDFLTLTLGIMVEALPFVILGVVFSVLIQAFVSAEGLLRWLPTNGMLRRLSISFMGVLMPVCECGNIPVARSLMMKGLSVQESIVFLLAAPSINIVTFVVTWEAFSFNHSVAVVRVLATLVVANLAALLVAKLVPKGKALTQEFEAVCAANSHAKRSWLRITALFRSEMWLITRMLLIGAMVAAASQTFIPRDVITAIGSNLWLSVVAMLLLAFVISICSSVDAFFALAYVNTFSLGSILAFLVAGPMVDIKIISLMKTTYTYRVIAIITGAVFTCSLLIGVVFSYVWR